MLGTTESSCERNELDGDFGGSGSEEERWSDWLGVMTRNLFLGKKRTIEAQHSRTLD